MTHTVARPRAVRFTALFLLGAALVGCEANTPADTDTAVAPDTQVAPPDTAVASDTHLPPDTAVAECQSAADCPTPLACRQVQCDAGRCVSGPNPASLGKSCDDGVLCTNAFCDEGGACTVADNGLSHAVCAAALDAAEADCTVATCTLEGCVYAADGGAACAPPASRQPGLCAAREGDGGERGVCEPIPCEEPIDCPAEIGPCAQPTCVEGVCGAVPDPGRDGLPCPSSSACTTGHRCVSGVCTFDAQVACEGVSVDPPDGAHPDCVLTRCDEAASEAAGERVCVALIDPAGGACDDGVACTSATCNAAGQCQATSQAQDDAACGEVLSASERACTASSCTADGCAYVPAESGSPCEVGGDAGACEQRPREGGGQNMAFCVPDDGRQCTTADDCGDQLSAVVERGADAACVSAACDAVTGLCVVSTEVGAPCPGDDACHAHVCDGAGGCIESEPIVPIPEACDCGDDCEIAQELSGVYSILPPGQDGVINGVEALLATLLGTLPAFVADQLDLYEALVYEDATPGFTAEKLDDYFKRAPIGKPAGLVGREYRPGGRDDVIVRRDARYNVPHIVGTTRYGAMYGQGYATAEDRLFLMDVLRHVGRGEVSKLLGASAGNLKMDADQLRDAPYTEADLRAQADKLRDMEGEGALIAADADAYLDGVNQYISEALVDVLKLPSEYPALQILPSRFVVEDIIAIASLVGGIFGKGGGGEVANYCGLQRMRQEGLSAAEARAVFDDFKFANDPEAPASAPTGDFPYMSDLGPVDSAAIPDIDCDSLVALVPPEITLPSGVASIVGVVPTPPIPDPTAVEGLQETLPGSLSQIGFPEGLSNALLVAGAQTDDGVPIAVFGPQTSYFAPQLLVEKSVIGPGIAARGAAFAGTDIYVQLGRGLDFAWSATSASSDMVDQVVLVLCDPAGGEATLQSTGYVYKGACKPIEQHHKTLLAKPSAAGIPPETLLIQKYFERAPDYGPISARGFTLSNTPIAIASRRATYQDELGSARGFQRLNDPTYMTNGYASFRQAVGDGIDYTFNWFFIDQDDIGYQHSCKCPERAQGVDPYLPTWGDGAWDWTGFVSYLQQPHALNPEQGYLTSWNNLAGHGWTANDRQFSYGPIHRATMLNRRIEAKIAEGPVDVGDAVDVMELAGTTDLRAQELVPLLAEVMGQPPTGTSGRVANMLARLKTWAADDLGHRRDHDADGLYEHAAAIAIMDAWWPRLVRAMFDDQSARAFALLGLALHDDPRYHIGSAFISGAYSHVHKELRTVLGQAVEAPFSGRYCGGGDRAACRADLWASLAQAETALIAEFGSGRLLDWRRTVADDAIIHVALGLVPVRPIHWVNRPTFQQVVQFGSLPDGK